MVDQGDAQPKGPYQRELVNLGCLLPYQIINGNVKIAIAEEEEIFFGLSLFNLLK
jgi:hypothetical protein